MREDGEDWEVKERLLESKVKSLQAENATFKQNNNNIEIELLIL